MNDTKSLIEAMTSSKIYQDYERAFTQATGMVVALRPAESWQLPHHGQRSENGFCGLMAQKSKSCAACLQLQQRISEAAVDHAASMTCAVGMCDTAVPVKVGSRLIGYLHTGQVFRKKPTEAQFHKTRSLMVEWGLETSEAEARKLYFETRVMGAKQHDSVVSLLEIFAQHLSIVSNQVLVQKENSESPVISKAKEFIRQHQSEDLSLGQVARAVNTSSFYFCKIFKKFTGINFTDYLSRIRIENAKNLLLNRNLRVSEIAYEVGFQSLTHFNRVFKRIVGLPPTEYRLQLPTLGVRAN